MTANVWILTYRMKFFTEKKIPTINPTSFSKDVDSDVISVCVSISGVELDII